MVISIVLAILFLAAPGVEMEYDLVPERQDRGEVVGHVLNEGGTPIEYANVVLIGTKMGAMSGESGEFILKNVLPGVYEIRIAMLNHYSQTHRFELKPSTRARITVRLVYGENIPGQYFCPEVE